MDLPPSSSRKGMPSHRDVELVAGSYGTKRNAELVTRVLGALASLAPWGWMHWNQASKGPDPASGPRRRVGGVGLAWGGNGRL